MTKEAFLAFIDEREERYEFDEGRAVMMARVTRNHAVVTVNLIAALNQRMSADRHDIASGAFAVHVGSSVRFPDILVQPRLTDGSALEGRPGRTPQTSPGPCRSPCAPAPPWQGSTGPKCGCEAR
jgi:Uma2 family endonuclease